MVRGTPYRKRRPAEPGKFLRDFHARRVRLFVEGRERTMPADNRSLPASRARLNVFAAMDHPVTDRFDGVDELLPVRYFCTSATASACVRAVEFEIDFAARGPGFTTVHADVLDESAGERFFVFVSITANFTEELPQLRTRMRNETCVCIIFKTENRKSDPPLTDIKVDLKYVFEDCGLG